MNRISHKYPVSLQRQRGLTLVELMVSLFISLALVGGIIAFASSNKGTYTMQSEMGRLQENARFALDTIASHVGSAGFRTIEPVPPNVGIVPFDFITPNLPQDNVTANLILNLMPGNNMGSDTLTINRQAVVGDDEDCLGQAIAVNTQITSTYYIADLDGNNLYDLYCLGNGNPTPQTLVEGVDNMQILYGVDTDGDNVANEYLSASNVMNTNPLGNPPTTDWYQNIVSLRISLLMSTVAPLRTDAIDATTFNLLNTPTMGPLNDGGNRIRRVFTRTILVRANVGK